MHRPRRPISLPSVFALLALSVSPIFAQPRQSASTSFAVAAPESLSPDFGPGLAAPDRWAFTAAFKSAVRQLQERRPCAALFTGLELDGLQALTGTRYERASSRSDRALCKGGISAITSINGSRTRLCHLFSTLPQNDKASILIHEALHTAGLGEWSGGPHPLTSRDITGIVKRACAL